MGKVLYRKYRSKSLDEVVGQEHITNTLKSGLKSGKIAHAYLFSGPRGVGKTSVARILAHEVNNLPYDDDTTHIDIIEIDAASNRRIDEIRELRDRIHIAPTSSKYKVYIIDEVHMLTKEAFNALLKTLEEPPEHAIFILATTEAHKVPETIISRTQRYSFRPIPTDSAVKHLQAIAKTEGIKISVDALEKIAEHSQGSFRDSISLLDQVSSVSQEVTLKDVDETLGNAPFTVVNKLLISYTEGNALRMLELIEQCRIAGYNSAIIARQLASLVRDSIIKSLKDTHETDTKLLSLLKELTLVPTSHDPYTVLELALLGGSDGVTTINKPRIDANEAQSPRSEKIQLKSTKDLAPKKGIRSSNLYTMSNKKVKPLASNKWQDILIAAQKRHNTLYSVLRMAKPTINDKELLLTFAFPFHQKRIEDSKNKEVLSSIVEETIGHKLIITCVTDGGLKVESPISPEATENETIKLEAISNIFGDTEVLE